MSVTQDSGGIQRMLGSCVQSGHAALVGALRREEAAARCVARLTAELEAVKDVVKQREMDGQRTKMIIRLKEDKIARLQVTAGPRAASTLSP